MKYIALFLAGFILSYIHVLRANESSLEHSLMAANVQSQALQAKSEKCAKAAANFAYIIDKKLYSEESAARIYQECLKEL